MKKLLSFTFDLIVVGLLLAGCGSAGMPIPTVKVSVLTSTPSVTATLIPSATTPPELPISPEASAYLEEALAIMQNNSFHRQNIDWDTVRKSAFKMAQHAQTSTDTYEAIRHALSRLGDHHSLLRTPEEVAQVQQGTVKDSHSPRGKLLLDKVGFIAITSFESGNPREESKYATNVQQLIRELDAQNPCGWIVDLRETSGDSIWPVLAGLGPILGEGTVGAFVNADGHKEIWSYQDGRARLRKLTAARVNGPAYQLRASFPPVAVLTGIRTASVGEAIAVAFRGRSYTHSFGLPTAGVPTANTGFPLSDGAWIFVTTAVYADRTGRTYGDSIAPDELVEDAREFTLIMEEAIPQPAIDWLMRQPACRAQP